MISFFKKLFGTSKTCCGGGGCKREKLLDHGTLLGFTESDTQALKNIDPKVIIGKVLNIEAHPNPKMTKVRVAQVQLDGNGTTETICCGGTNLEEGQIVAVATVGARLSEDFEIGVRDLRGVESRGMICARKELGFSANGEVDKEIWALDPQYEALLGQSLCTFL